jgi:hypothetical protein
VVLSEGLGKHKHIMGILEFLIDFLERQHIDEFDVLPKLLEIHVNIKKKQAIRH